MTDIPLPSPGDTSWSDWGQEQEDASDVVLSGRLSDTELRAAFDVVSTTAELLAAFTASKKLIRLKSGVTFTISAPLVPPSGTYIDVRGATIQAASATGNLLSSGWHFQLDNSDCQIVGATFIAPATALTLGSAEDAVIHVTGARNKVVGCKFATTGIDSAVFVKGTTALGNVIADNDIDGSRIVYSYAGASRTTCRGNRVENAPNRALGGVNNGGAGVWNTDCLVADNVVLNSASMGIEDSGQGTIIRGNRIVNPADIAISAVGILALVEENTIYAPASEGIEVGSSGTKVTNNQVVGATTGVPYAGVVINSSNSSSSYRGAAVEGNSIRGFESSVKAIDASGYYTLTVSGNVLQDWIGSAVNIGSGLGGTVTGNALIQTLARPGGNRNGVSLLAPCTVVGNRFIYTSSAAGTAAGADVAIRPAPGADASQIIGNLIDGGGITTFSGVQAIATGGANPANVLIVGNTATGSASFDYNFLVTPFVFGNSGSQANIGNVRWSAFAATPAAKPTVSGSRGGNAALASLISALATLGLVTDSTTS